MSQFTDYYAVLGISQNATTSEINTAYKKLCLKWHPDRNPLVDTNMRMQEINEAKRILSDKTLRENHYKKYHSFRKKSTSQPKSKTENKKSEDVSPKGTYVCNLRSDDDLICICANAAKYNFEYIHAVLQELKKRNYSLDTINRIIKHKATPTK